MDAIGTFKFDGTILSSNSGAERLYGIPTGNMVGRNIYSFYPEDRKKDLEIFLAELKLGKQIKGFESQRIKPDGSIMDVFQVMTPIMNAKGEYDSYLTVLHDITDQKKKERKLQESESRFRLLAENVNDVIWTLDLEGRFLYVSPSVVKLRGYSPEEVMQQSITDSLTPASVETALRSLGKSIPLIRAGEHPPSETLLLEQPCKNGSTVWTEVSVSSIFDESGEFLFFLGVTRDISSRLAAEEALKKSESSFRLITENIHDIIWTFDITGRFLYISPSVERLRGYKPEEVLNQSLMEAVCPGSFDFVNKTFLELIKNVSAGERIPTMQFPVEQPCKNGSTVWTEVTLNATYDERGLFLFFLGVTRDITARKIIEDQLILKEEAIKSSISAIAITSLDGGVIYVNDAFTKMWGFSSDREILGRNFTEFSAAPDKAKGVIEMVTSGKSMFSEVEGKRKDGNIFNLQISVNPVHTKEGKLSHIMASFIDITEKKQREIEQRLTAKRIEAQYRMSLMEDKSEVEIVAFALDEAVSMTSSLSGFFHFVDEDQHLLTMTGWNSESMLKCEMPGVTHYPVAEAGIWARCLTTQKPFICNDYQNAVDTKSLPDGHIPMSRFVSVPVLEKEKVVLVIGVGNKPEDYDEAEVSQLTVFMEEVWKIIKKTRLSEELRKATEKAEESSKLKSSLLLNMSHELRTPLNGILGFAGLLKEMIVDPDSRDMVNYINISGKRLMVTLTSILELSQIESNRKIVSPTNVRLSELVHNVISRFNEQLEFKKLPLSKMIEDDIVLSTDQGMVANIFYYIVDNAIKFTDAGQVWVDLRKVFRKGEEQVLFLVRDTGIGISEELQKMIFEPFRQGSEGIGRSHEGNGLGLTLCKKFLDMLGGEIEVESQPELGSTFSVWFKAAGKENISEKHTSTANEIKTTFVPGIPMTKGKQKVLIVEDNEINAEFLIMLLEDRFNVEKAMTGQMAVKLSTINDYDIILMDINLGAEMDGIETTREIRRNPKNIEIPVIAVTGYSTDQERQAILDHGLNEYLPKPFTREELNAVINRVLI